MSEPPVVENDFFPHGQIRLAELSVFNWGSFHGLHKAQIDLHGTLITGDNGAGKSTLVDGLIALLLPSSKATFNIAAAQDDKADRSMVSYVRGSYGSERDGIRTRVQSKRIGAVITGLRASYVADDGSQYTLASLLWISNSSSALADVKRLYFVATRDLTLEELLDTFERGQARAVRQKYRDDGRVSVFDTFGEYQETYQRALCIYNRNAPALLARALGLKKIDDLTSLIREFVLEPSTVRDAARDAVSEFSDLVATHNELIDARRQQEVLANLPTLKVELDKATIGLIELDEEKSGLPIYFAEQSQRLWGLRVSRIDAEVKQVELNIEQLRRAESDIKAQVEARHAEYIQAGGGQVEDVKKDVARAKDLLTQTTEVASRYQQTVRELSLDDRLLEAVFLANRQAAAEAEREFNEQKKAAQDRFGLAASALSVMQQQRAALRNDLKEVEQRPNSAIDPVFQKLRDRMVASLGFEDQELMFIGELIDVKDEERAWQGAIERALGGLRLTLAVPESRFRLVTSWLNGQHVGLHVRVQVVRDSKISPRFKEDGFLRKLEWRPHPYRDWLKQHLARFDLACVPDTATLDATPFSMTQQGLIHHESGRAEKKDLRRIDDRTDWYLGFSNVRRLAILQGQLREQELKVAQADRDATVARESLDATENKLRHWKELLTMRWERIDVPRARHLLKEAEQTLSRLEESGLDLAEAKKRWESAKAGAIRVQGEIDDRMKALGAVKKDMEQAEASLQRAQQTARAGIVDAVRDKLISRVGELADEHLDMLAAVESTNRSEIELALNEVRGKFDVASRKAVSTMSAYRSRDEWQTITADWGKDLADLATYLERLEHIEREGLPKLVERFRERLNRHTTHSLAGIRSQINNELDEIRERIDTINVVLARTEFRRGTYLRLKAELDEYEHVREFNRLLQGVMQAATSDDHEARFKGLQVVVSILEKATSSSSGYTKESQRLLDPRYRLSFVAEDVEKDSGQVLDVLASSSGKSGGEKEAFAGTVVAASLAYVLTPSGSDKPIYCTVFLDEAFSNTAEAVSRRVLRVFRALQIHVNLITPFKNLNLARESARLLLIAERDEKRHESRLCQVTWEEIDKKLAERATLHPKSAVLADVVLEPDTP